MTYSESLSDFFDAIEHDGRISITHIGVYAALLHFWKLTDYEIPFLAFSYDIMKIAKVSSDKTYRRCAKDLHQFGYIKYEPSYKKNRASKIWVSQSKTIINNQKPLL